MSGFSSNLTYSDPMGYGMPGFIDTTSGNFVPYFYVPNTTITEQFNPLIGINAMTKNGTGLQFSYVKGRAVSLSLVNYQVSEVHNSGFTIGATYKKKGIVLPFKVPFSGKDTHRLDNDMIFKLDLSIINNSTSNSIIDQNLTTPVAGNKTINIAPSIDYAVNKKIDFRLFFKQTRIIPYISSSPPSVNTQGGVEFKVSLAK
jgi:cell surface protein SprA